MDWQRLSAFPDQALTGAHGIVYWAIREGSVWHQGRRLRAADAASFEVMPGHVFIARDVHSVYHAWTRMPAIDRDSFHRNGDYWQDAGNVYFEHETSLKPLDAVDVGAFRSLGGGYGADRTSAWYCGRRIKHCTQGERLQVLAEDLLYAFDADTVYCDGKPLPGVERSQWRRLEAGFSRDDTRIYYLERKLPRVDAASWRHLQGSWSRDRNHVFHMNRIEPDPTARGMSLPAMDETPR